MVAKAVLYHKVPYCKSFQFSSRHLIMTFTCPSHFSRRFNPTSATVTMYHSKLGFSHLNRHFPKELLIFSWYHLSRTSDRKMKEAYSIKISECVLVSTPVFLKVVRTAPLGALRKCKGAVGGYALNGGCISL
ncbi:hypothetical protein FHG87_014127 [Trinorchestia longiramus]|nr:hypothetical protein FHG87_014127 [Trinorchestia longiramus]